MSGHCEICGESVGPGVFRCTCPSANKDMKWNARVTPQLSEKEWTDILSGLSLGDVNDRPRFAAYDESYCLSRRDCAKMAQQLVRHFAPRTAPNTCLGRTARPNTGTGS